MFFVFGEETGPSRVLWSAVPSTNTTDLKSLVSKLQGKAVAFATTIAHGTILLQ